MSRESASWSIMNKEGTINIYEGTISNTSYPVGSALIDPGTGKKVVIHSITFSPTATYTTCKLSVSTFSSLASTSPNTVIVNGYGVNTAPKPIDLDYSNAPIVCAKEEVIKAIVQSGTAPCHVVIAYNIVNAS